VIPQNVRRYLPLALVSFLSVYLELIVIRWLASEVRIFAYFKNFPLLAAFLGFGVGCLIAKRRKGYFKYAPYLLLILSAVICFAYRFGYTHITFVDPYETYLIGIFSFNVFQMFKGAACVLGIFILTTLLFVTVCEKLGECLEEFPPLTAYTVNVAFSLAGILLYAWMSWMQWGPAIWLAVAACAIAPFFLAWPRRSGPAIWGWFAVPALITIALPVLTTPSSAVWSPYYRIDVQPMSLADKQGKTYPLGYTVEVNHDGILGAYNFSPGYVQTLPPEVQAQLLDYYNVPYRVFGDRFRRIAVLGSGGGNDVATALRNNVQSVDAVEIDPGIIEIGKQYHAEHPYQSSRVHIVNGDARTFLREQGGPGYDMIVFGALDSHAVFSSMSSVRIDNYVYTVESFSEALKRLNSHGILAVTFYCYKDWQLEHVYNALWKANLAKPVVVHSLGAGSNNLVMFAGPGADRDTLLAQPYVQAQNAENMTGHGTVEPTTDDWPFLYLRERGFPLNYGYMLVLILGFSYIVVARGAQIAASKFDGVMFLLGVGFMLLETKVLAKTALLAGATWIVNTFVISAVLAMILLANTAVMRGWFTKPRWALPGLAISVLLDLVVKLNSVSLVEQPALNLALTLFLLALPLFFASILFADCYARVPEASVALGYNLLGAMVGGVLEYCSMAWGINNLNLLCLAAYAGVAILIYRRSWASSPQLARVQG
jgi:Spermine/spermidine synthase domain